MCPPADAAAAEDATGRGGEAPVEVLSPDALRDWPLPVPDGSKHSRGHVVVVGGSASTPGAVRLAGEAALRVGAGVLALAVPDVVAVPLAVAVPEAGVTPLDGDLAGLVGQADAVLVGPGLDDPDLSRHVVDDVVAALPDGVPVVVDAFALGVLPGLTHLRPRLAGRTVLTPNARELARLCEDGEGSSRSDPGPADLARVARRWEAVVSAQGLVVGPDGRVRSVATGHAGLGTSGSGDVLSGAVAGLLARGVAPEQAACWATYLHAAAGDRLAAQVGRLGFLARELLDQLPRVLTELQV